MSTRNVLWELFIFLEINSEKLISVRSLDSRLISFMSSLGYLALLHFT